MTSVAAPQLVEPRSLVEDFVAYAEGISSPNLFKRWAGISLVAGLLERRVWLRTGRGIMFPNLYTFLIAPPGIGKKVIEEVRHLWEQVHEPNTLKPALKVASDSMTRASFIDELVSAKMLKVPPTGAAYEYHALTIAQEEWSVLFPAYDLPFLATLTALWGNRENHRESRRTGASKAVTILRPTINLLAGYQPALMATTFPEEAWTSGFTRRLLMIYSGSRPHRDLFAEAPATALSKEDLLKRLGLLTSPRVYGQYDWTLPAKRMLSDWDAAGGPPSPDHPKLEHYNQSRTEFVLKLSMIHAASLMKFPPEHQIDESDITWAIDTLCEAEERMPDVFRQMVGKSDTAILDELHFFVTALYARRQNVAIPRHEIMRFIAERTTSDKVGRMFETADRSGYINRTAGTDGEYATYVPGVRSTFKY